MIEILDNKEECCGCKACINICPVNCITMQKDKEGFLYPNINTDNCIDCGKCKSVCPIINGPADNIMKQEVYSSWTKDEDIKSRASSGGIFETLAKDTILKEGVVFGAAFDIDNQLKHKCASKIEDLKPLCKSKYIQSDMNTVYDDIRNYLKEEKKVLFVGTPCQVAGVSNYIGSDHSNNLILVDLICHGVPSQDLFNKCMAYEEKKRNIEIKKYSFRTKIEKGSTPHYYTEGYLEKNKYKERIGYYHNSPYYYGFQKRITLRPSCYICPYSSPKRISDITIGDFHEINRYIDSIDRMEGVSMVIINTEKGKRIFNDIKDTLILNPFNMEIAISTNECLSSSTPLPEERKQFFKNLETKDFSYVISKHLTSSKALFYDVYYSLPSSIRKIVKKLVLRGTV